MTDGCAIPSLRGYGKGVLDTVKQMLAHRYEVRLVWASGRAEVLGNRIGDPVTAARAWVEVGDRPDRTGLIPLVIRWCDPTGKPTADTDEEVYYHVHILAWRLLQ